MEIGWCVSVGYSKIIFFYQLVDNVIWPQERISEADASSVGPSPE